MYEKSVDKKTGHKNLLQEKDKASDEEHSGDEEDDDDRRVRQSKA
jgi:hypothetical protein